MNDEKLPEIKPVEPIMPTRPAEMIDEPATTPPVVNIPVKEKIKEPKKKSDSKLYIFLFIIIALFIIFLPTIKDILDGNFSFSKNTEKTTEEPTTKEVANKKDAAWFETYILPLHRSGYFGSYTSKKPNTGTKKTADANLLLFGFDNTIGISENIMDQKYEYTSVEDTDEGATLYYSVPEKEIKALIKTYFGKDFTYQPAKSGDNIEQYYDKDAKTYVHSLYNIIGTGETFNITNVVYDEYDITLTYNTVINGLICSEEYSNESIISGTGTLKLYYNDGDYIYKSNSYKINETYSKCWEE
ncbi:MAG: hypothetical protein PHQ89_02265 [Bacilli bacterium]|nr:hypothetical protein [Bacilli bacterium]